MIEPLSDCIEWQKYRDPQGYGRQWFRGKKWFSHRVAYTEAYGEIPDGMFVCHKCDNPPCINPKHLFLGTNADNMADRDAKGRQARQKGTANGRAKLTADDVRAIRADGRSQSTIANDYGISHVQVSNIKSRKTWSHVEGDSVKVDHRKKLTEDDVRAIRADGRLQREIANDYGISHWQVSRIKHRKTWAHLA